MRWNRNLAGHYLLGAFVATGAMACFLFWKMRASPAIAAYERGKTLASAHLNADAVAVYQEAIRLDPHYAPPYRALAEIATDQGELATAITRWQEYLAHAPGAKHAWCRLAGVRLSAGQAALAMHDAEEELKRTPDCGRANLIAGLLYERSSQGRSAVEHLAAAVRSYPNEPRIALVYGRVLVQSGDFDRAETILQEVAAKDPANAEAFRWLGSIYARRPATAANVRLAEQNLRRALALRPNYAEAHYELARQLFAQHRTAEALPFAQQAATLRKHFPRALSLESQVYEALGKHAEAERTQQEFRKESDLYARQEALRKQLSLDRTNVDTALELAQVLLKRDEPESALRILTEIAPNAHDDARVQAALKHAEEHVTAHGASAVLPPLSGP